MGEPSGAVYEAAYEAFKRAPLGSSIVRARVDAVWPLAVAEGRRQAALEFVAVEEAGEEKGEGYWAARSIADGTDHA